MPAQRTIFALGSAAALATLVWVSVETLRLERERGETEAAAELEQEARLALWRMDGLVAPIVATESSRPHFHYTPLYSPLKALSPTWDEISAVETLVASPLLTAESKYVRLHFEIADDGSFSSPQVLTEKQRALAADRYVDRARVDDATSKLERLRRIVRPEDARAAVAEARVQQLVDGQAARSPVPRNVESLAPAQQEAPTQAEQQSQPRKSSSWLSRAPREYVQRQQQVMSNTITSSRNWSLPNIPWLPQGTPGPMIQGEMTARWYAGEMKCALELMLLRKVRSGKSERIQGVWLDWPALRADLVAAIAEDFPGAKLTPRTWDLRDDDLPRALASIPVMLVPGPRPARARSLMSPARVALLAAWIAVGGAVLASGLALRASRQLSDRRARFVSAVTHELRTPLTTFRLYTDMLSSEMVTDEAKRKEYIGTLTTEADRLGLLVENVLSYSRLEEGRAKREPAPVAVGDLLERASARATERAEACGAELTVTIPEDVRAATAIADEAAVEQILFNLVDNACKHALDADGEASAIELAARRSGWHVIVRVRDYGPGIESDMRGRLFEPFSRGEGVTAAGSGLGLALSRELARACGGELTCIAPREGSGAAFELTLPLEIERG